MIVVSLTTVNDFAGMVPKLTAVARVKPVPVIVTEVPPAAAPLVGLRPVTVGVDWIVIGVLRVWLSRVTEADAVPGVLEVKSDEAMPERVGTEAGAIVPPVALKAIGIWSGKKGAVEWVASSESFVKSAVTTSVAPGPIVAGEAERVSTSQGLVFTVPVPVVVSLPVVFGPVLLPHQFSVASAVVVVVLSTPTELPTMRLKLAIT